MTLLPNALKFFVERMREAFAVQKLLKCFQQKYWLIWNTNFWNFKETLTTNVISFEQQGPGGQ